MIVWKHKYCKKKSAVFFFLNNCVRPSNDSFHPSTLLTIASYMMQVTLPPGAGRVSQGRAGWDGMGGITFFSKASAGSTFPPPKPTHLPPTLYFAL